MEYMVKTTEDFFEKLDKIQRDLADFSQAVDSRRDTAFTKLEEFEKASGGSAPHTALSQNPVDEALRQSIENIQKEIGDWRRRIESNKKGAEFMKVHEKYLVVMVFGAVKAGKSTLGNFLAGQKFLKAGFDNAYKHREHPCFAIAEGGRATGSIKADEDGLEWFCEGVTDTTGAIQYFTTSGLRWFDSPGTGALHKAGDTRDMEEMVKEYISYTDMCVFLMNSSEPGLQEDMKYMKNLSREGQEAIVVITKSDKNEEDEDENGDLITCWRAKPPEDRRRQEEDICRRLKDAYPYVDANRYRAISVSTLLAGEAIKKNDDGIFRESGLDQLMKILGDKVSDKAIELKKRKPRQNLNNFIESILNGEETSRNGADKAKAGTNELDSDGEQNFHGVAWLEKSLDSILEPIQEYQQTIEERTRKISNDICAKARQNVRRKVDEWNSEVESTGKSIDRARVTQTIQDIVTPLLQQELNQNIGKIIEDYQEQKLGAFTASFDAELAKQSKTVTESYTTVNYEEREPDGFWENFRSFFGKTYYRKSRDTNYIERTIDMGTNKGEFVESLTERLKENVDRQVREELARIQKNYFAPQEKYVKEMRQALSVLRRELESLKFAN